VLARAVTHALVGLEARRVEVEADVKSGVPAFVIVGLPDRACAEARQRVKRASSSW
jgi:magnesium chelatase family protein